MRLVSQEGQAQAEAEAEAEAEVDHRGHLFLDRGGLEKGLLVAVAAACVEAFSFRMKLALEQLRGVSLKNSP